MNISSGRFKGAKLLSPSGLSTRPTAAKVRAAFLNMMQADIDGALILDLFAGSGAVGLEALSRGARGCVFVEKDHEALKYLIKNVEEIKSRALKIGDIVSPLEVVSRDVHHVWKDLAVWAPYDIVWVDPPYKNVHEWLMELSQQLLNITANDATLAVESGFVKANPSDFGPLSEKGWTKIKEKSYGETLLTIWKRSS